MARKLTEEELSKVTGGASVAWCSSLSPGGGTLYTNADLSAKNSTIKIVGQRVTGAVYDGFESAEDNNEGITVSTPTGAKGFWQIGL